MTYLTLTNNLNNYMRHRSFSSLTHICCIWQVDLSWYSGMCQITRGVEVCVIPGLLALIYHCQTPIPSVHEVNCPNTCPQSHTKRLLKHACVDFRELFWCHSDAEEYTTLALQSSSEVEGTTMGRCYSKIVWIILAALYLWTYLVFWGW